MVHWLGEFALQTLNVAIGVVLGLWVAARFTELPGAVAGPGWLLVGFGLLLLSVTLSNSRSRALSTTT